MNKNINKLLQKVEFNAVKEYREKVGLDINDVMEKIDKQLINKDSFDKNDVALLNTKLSYMKTYIDLFNLKEAAQKSIRPDAEKGDVRIQVGSIEVLPSSEDKNE